MSKFCLYLTLAIVLTLFTANNHAIESIEIVVNDHGEPLKEPVSYNAYNDGSKEVKKSRKIHGRSIDP